MYNYFIYRRLCWFGLLPFALVCVVMSEKNIPTLKKTRIAPWVVNEVIKKASTLTANGDPQSSGRSLFKGLAFLSTVPKNETISCQLFFYFCNDKIYEK